MENINQFLNYEWGYVFFGLILLIVVVLFVLDKVDAILNRLGITTRKQIEKQKTIERIQKLERHDKWQYEKMSEISDGINSIQKGLAVIEENAKRIEKENDIRRMNDLKSEILAFSRSLKRFDSDGMADDFDSEDYDRVFEAFSEYMGLIKKYKLTNGKTIRAMTLINAHSDKNGYGTTKLDG